MPLRLSDIENLIFAHLQTKGLGHGLSKDMLHLCRSNYSFQYNMYLTPARLMNEFPYCLDECFLIVSVNDFTLATMEIACEALERFKPLLDIFEGRLNVCL